MATKRRPELTSPTTSKSSTIGDDSTRPSTISARKLMSGVIRKGSLCLTDCLLKRGNISNLVRQIASLAQEGGTTLRNNRPVRLYEIQQ